MKGREYYDVTFKKVRIGKMDISFVEVEFTDFQRCKALGCDWKQAFDNAAKEGLAKEIGCAREKNEPIPGPSTLKTGEALIAYSNSG